MAEAHIVIRSYGQDLKAVAHYHMYEDSVVLDRVCIDQSCTDHHDLSFEEYAHVIKMVRESIKTRTTVIKVPTYGHYVPLSVEYKIVDDEPEIISVAMIPAMQQTGNGLTRGEIAMIKDLLPKGESDA